jgi:hypothetical protein
MVDVNGNDRTAELSTPLVHPSSSCQDSDGRYDTLSSATSISDKISTRSLIGTIAGDETLGTSVASSRQDVDNSAFEDQSACPIHPNEGQNDVKLTAFALAVIVFYNAAGELPVILCSSPITSDIANLAILLYR